jgi:hypothetical protein
MMQNGSMRTTVSIADSTYETASEYARANGITLGKAFDALVDKAISPKNDPVKIKIMPDGLPSLPSRGKRITPELVKSILEEEFE